MIKSTRTLAAALALLTLTSTGCSTLLEAIAAEQNGKTETKTTEKAVAEAEPEPEPEPEAPDPEPNAELPGKMLSCIKDLPPMDVQTGRVGRYKFTEGMNTSERTGFLDRAPVEMTDGCYLGEIQPGQCLAMTLDEKKYAALGNSNDWEVQCIYADDPSAGMIKNKSEYAYDVENLSPYYFMLMCNNDQDSSYACAEGSNSMRGIAHREKLEKQGKTQLGFCANTLLYQELSYDHKAYPKGRYLYCQYYNSQSKKSAFGWQQLVNWR